jgi:hypothetical protein
MLRAFFARAVAVAAVCATVLGCSASDRTGSTSETNVSAHSEALEAGADSGTDSGTDAGDGGVGAPPPCMTDADCGDGCGVCTAGVCGIAASTVTCRTAVAGGCDVAEKCDGLNKDCPADAFAASTVVCHTANGVCDPAVTCTGTSATCPGPAFAPTTTVCHASQGVCDPAENCDGAGNCPLDAKLGPADGVCRPTVLGGCAIPAVCNGVSNDCPADAVANNTVVCHTGNGVCDPALNCTGSSAACPAAVLAPNTTPCRAAQGLCDAPENCDGAGHCPADAKLGPTANPSPCGAAKGPCDIAEVCSGFSNDCPTVDAKQPNTVACRTAAPSDLCDVTENCDGVHDACPPDVFKAPSLTPCRAAPGKCDVAEYCTGLGPSCPADAFQPTSAVPCRDKAGDCDEPEFCTGAAPDCPADLLSPSTKQCRDIIQPKCDVPEYCTGASVTCPLNSYAVKGTACDDAIPCTEGDTCDGNGTCQGIPATDVAKVEQFCQASTHLCAFTSCALDGCKFSPKTPQICRPSVGSCDVAESCDGTAKDCPPDVIDPSTTQCQALSCAGGTLKPAIQCDGVTGVCPTVASSSCGNFACGSATDCRTTCVTSDDCGSAFYCSNNDCIPRIGAGQKCKTDSECPISNNHCVDGVCCDTTCTGQCEACNTTGNVGTCVGVKGDPVTPRAKCAADGTKCDGFCDPSNRTACQFPTKTTSCRDASCDVASNGALAESFCTGKGSCALTKPTDCEPYACSGTACAGNCTADVQCAKDAYCASGKCTPKGKPADTCTTDKQCGSGHCADGVCCDTACTGQCEACNNVPGADAGTCSPVTGAPLGKKTACAANDAACGGTCDGKNRLTCNYPAQGKACRDGACADATATATSYCDGHGACPAAVTVSCEKGCEGTVCAGDECALDSDCKAPGKYCAAGACAPKVAPGAACSSASACQSGFCTDGVCCDSACLGQCEACDSSGNMGTCSAVPKGDSPHGGRTSCASDGSVCGGTCDGSARDVCKYPFDVTCRAGACAEAATADDQATSVLEATCIGNGSCPAEQQQLCAQDGCDVRNKLCNGACAADKNACQKGEYCSAGECVAKLGPADVCANDAQCASNFCVDGVCCDKRCGDQCAACDVPGSVGQCTPVAGAAHGGRAACGGVGTCGAACDGTIVASCSFADNTVSCGDAFCSAGVKGAAPVCDGDGTCAPAKTTACSSFACDGAECSNACTEDSDCVKQFECRKGVCLPPVLIDAVDKGTCGCSAPGSRSRAPASLWVVLGLCGAVLFRRRRSAA